MKRITIFSLVVVLYISLSYSAMSQSWSYGATNDILYTDLKVGIGENNPAEKFQVNGRMRLMTQINGAGTWYEAVGSNDWFVGLNTTDQFRFFHNGDNRLVIDSNGNVGIWADNPEYKLDVHGTIAAGRNGKSGQILFRRSSDENTVGAVGFKGDNESLNFQMVSSSGGGISYIFYKSYLRNHRKDADYF